MKGSGANHYPPLVETICISTRALEHVIDDNIVEPRDWQPAQRNDPIIGPIIKCVQEGVPPRPGHTRGLDKCPEAIQFSREFNNLKLRRGVLFRVTKDNDVDKWQLVLPRKFRTAVMKGLHDDVGHMGRDKTSELFRQRVYWPRMLTDIKLKLKSCERCFKRKTPVTDKAEFVNIKTTQPLELVCVDYMTLQMSKGGYQHILVITDHFTRYA